MDDVNNPSHYKQGRREVIDLLEESGIVDDHHLATAIQYILRARYKGSFIKDLKKAQWWISRRIHLHYERGDNEE